MKKLLCLLTALSLACATLPALAETSSFTAQLEIMPSAWPQDFQSLATGLQSLLRATVFRGRLSVQGEAFRLDAAADVNGCTVPVCIRGIPSHWVITTPLMAEVPLMLNNLALLEFGLKAEDYLDIPLQKAGLLMPYAHTSAWDAMTDAALPFVPLQDGEYAMTAQEVTFALNSLVDLAESDRTVRCYMDALGMSIYLLPEATSNAFADGLTICRTGDTLRWLADDTELAAYRCTDGMLSFTATIEGLSLDLHLYHDGSKFELLADASGDMLLEPLFLHLKGSLSDTLSADLLSRDGICLARLNADYTLANDAELLDYTPDALTGVNVLSLNAATLGDLMQQIGPSLLLGGLQLIAACPADAVQAMMDALEASGLIEVLASALLYGDAGNEY